MKLQDFSVGTPVVTVDGFYGYVVAAVPEEHHVSEAIPVPVVLANDSYGIWFHAVAELTRATGCECGNPFRLCHPEA